MLWSGRWLIRLFKNGKKQEGIAEESGGVQSALRLVVGFVLGRREGEVFLKIVREWVVLLS